MAHHPPVGKKPTRTRTRTMESTMESSVEVGPGKTCLGTTRIFLPPSSSRNMRLLYIESFFSSWSFLLLIILTATRFALVYVLLLCWVWLINWLWCETGTKKTRRQEWEIDISRSRYESRWRVEVNMARRFCFIFGCWLWFFPETKKKRRKRTFFSRDVYTRNPETVTVII